MLLNHTPPDEAEGKIADAYAVLPPGVPVPEPLVLHSASPDILTRQVEFLKYFMSHPRLDMELLAMTRYVLAHRFGYQFCYDFNSMILQAAAMMSDEDLATLREHPELVEMDDERKALFLFALKVVENPTAVTPQDIEVLHDLGWTDADIFDMSFHAASFLSTSVLWKAFAGARDCS
ncbi:MAG: carboxymuconolactone decarboxylase family protein [Oceanidesulfovibrio sp.]